MCVIAIMLCSRFVSVPGMLKNPPKGWHDHPPHAQRWLQHECWRAPRTLERPQTYCPAAHGTPGLHTSQECFPCNALLWKAVADALV